jgi:putative hydrolase of the HAD superfamily
MLDISRIRAISLDLDDTLWPIWPTIARAEERLQLWLSQHAPPTATLFADPDLRLGLREVALERLPHLAHDLSAIRQEMIRLGLERSGADPSLACDAFAVFFAARMEVDLFDDALPALAWLSQRYPVVALTNGNADVHRVGIGHFFTASLSAREVGVGKPDAQIFLAAAQRLGLSPEQILHVGDDAVLDVVGAQGVGMQTVWINRDEAPWGQHPPPDATVSSMSVLCDLLSDPGRGPAL